MMILTVTRIEGSTPVSQHAPDPGEEVRNWAGCLVMLITMVGVMVWAGMNVGFTGFVSVVVTLTIAFIVSAVAFGIVDAIMAAAQGVGRGAGPPSPASPPSTENQNRPRTAGPSTARPARQKTLSDLIRVYDTRLARRLRAFEKAAAERPEFTEEDRRSVVGKVEEMHHYHYTYQHIFNDRDHPDHPMVDQEMRRYRGAVSEFLQLKTDELTSGNYGGFAYRESLRTIEGHLELMRDEFGSLFEQLESDQDPRA